MVRIVLNSFWTERIGLNATLARLPVQLYRRVVGTTFEALAPRHRVLNLLPAERVLLDVQRRGPSGWVALDTERDGWPEWAAPHVIHTDGVSGIAPVAIQGALHSKLLVLSGGARGIWPAHHDVS